MDANRKLWNEKHQKLNRALSKGDRDTAVKLFLTLHAMIHSVKVSGSELWSFEDELLHDMTDTEIRQIPRGGEHSIAWILFHLARIEDITMNILVAGNRQLFTSDDWSTRMNASILHSANGMDESSVAELSSNLDIKSLRAYRIAVGKRTRQVVLKLQAKDFKQNVEHSRIEKVLREEAVTPETIGLLDYWSKKTIGGLLLMPPTRHCILHLNEAMRIKDRIRR